MAVNRFPQYAMRSRSEPAGFKDLPPHRQVKVDLGNGLAQVSMNLAGAQERVKSRWMKEQPSTSIMLDFAPVSLLFVAHAVISVIIDVCAFGAPWRKPIVIVAHFADVSVLKRKCSCTSPHLSLQGNAPDGRSWIAVASPYLLGCAVA